jgi:hypothetical protein
MLIFPVLMQHIGDHNVFPYPPAVGDGKNVTTRYSISVGTP